jgi:hypothetical protein
MTDLSDALVEDNSVYLGNDPSSTTSTAEKNTVVGVAALDGVTTGDSNVAMGYDALDTNTTGGSNTAIGATADVGSNNLDNATAVGYGATVTASNTIQLGNTSVTNVKTSGSITAGAITIPNTDGSANQVLKTDGSGTLSWSTQDGTGTDDQNISGSGLSGTTLTIGIEGGSSETVNLSGLQDGTGTDDQNISGSGLSGTTLTIGIEGGSSETVNLSGLQDGTGTDDQNISGSGLSGTTLTIGIEGGSSETVNLSGLQDGTGTDDQNISGSGLSGTTLTIGIEGGSNETVNLSSLSNADSITDLSDALVEDNSVYLGNDPSSSTSTAAYNVAVGTTALDSITTGDSNVAIGYDALDANTSGDNNTAIGYGADVGSNNLDNSTAIGNGAIVTASNTMQLGNTSVTNVKTSGTITAGAITIPNTDGSANQVLKTDGSGTLSWSSNTGAYAGDWSTSTAYTKGQMVFHKRKPYWALLAHSGTEPGTESLSCSSWNAAESLKWIGLSGTPSSSCTWTGGTTSNYRGDNGVAFTSYGALNSVVDMVTGSDSSVRVSTGQGLTITSFKVVVNVGWDHLSITPLDGWNFKLVIDGSAVSEGTCTLGGVQFRSIGGSGKSLECSQTLSLYVDSSSTISIASNWNATRSWRDQVDDESDIDWYVGYSLSDP